MFAVETSLGCHSSTTSFYQTDGLGAVASLSNASRSLANIYTYDSFGNRTASSGSLTNPFQYTARENDPETGLYYYRARYYDATVGRFLSEDLIGFSGGDTNVYRYSFGDPVNLEDPSGLTVTCTYNQHSGDLRCTDDSTGRVVVNTRGYSGGNEGKCPFCVNNPSAQGIPYSGPIPTGYWSMGKCMTWKKMPDVIPLTPMLGSSPDAFMRSPGFLIHGGRQNGAWTASEGCVIVGQPQRHAICQGGGGTMNVISGLPPATPAFPLFPIHPGNTKPFPF